MVTADHGLIDVEWPDQTLLEASDPLVERSAVPPSGDADADLHVRDGRRAEFQRQFDDRFGDRMLLVSNDEAEKLRLFGPRTALASRAATLGDFVAIAYRPATISYHPPGKPVGNRYLAVHAGLSPEEMLVPLVIA